MASAVSFLGVGSGAPSAPSATTSSIPPIMLALYQEAAATCPGLPWTVLAAIGTVESDNGQSNLPGVHTGANVAGAEGTMQFEPATFAKGSTRDWFADLRFQIAWRSPGVLTPLGTGCVGCPRTRLGYPPEASKQPVRIAMSSLAGRLMRESPTVRQLASTSERIEEPSRCQRY